jgi:hypothetical protein
LERDVDSPPTDLDASVITEPLDTMIGALANKLDREWPARFANIQGARELFLLMVRTADVTSRSIRFLSAEKPPDANRSPEYCLSLPPLNRTILDSIFTAMFVMEDLPGRCDWYYKAGWRETRMELDRYVAEYGHIPEWRDWLDRLKSFSDFGVQLLGISPTDVAQPAQMRRWPNAGLMPGYELSPTATVPPGRAFMRYLNDWFYKELSEQSHLGSSGLMKRASVLLYDRNEPQRANILRKNKYSWIGQTITLMLVLASEIEAFFRFGLREQIRYVWGVSNPVVVVAQEVYDKRYTTLLAQ